MTKNSSPLSKVRYSPLIVVVGSQSLSTVVIFVVPKSVSKVAVVVVFIDIDVDVGVNVEVDVAVLAAVEANGALVGLLVLHISKTLAI